MPQRTRTAQRTPATRCCGWRGCCGARRRRVARRPWALPCAQGLARGRWAASGARGRWCTQAIDVL
eukprot:1618371-Pyramimonas_sp.AAC.1